MTTPRIARVIVFAKDMKRMVAFYEDVIGLPRVATLDDSEDWQAFDAGGCQLALHGIPAQYADGVVITDPPVARESAIAKIAFHADDVVAKRDELVARGARMRAVQVSGDLALCDGVDPEGNLFQFSNR